LVSVWFSGVFVVPVHVLKRKGDLKPATTPHFFDRFRAVLLKLLDRVTLSAVEALP
jgi:hypothetical protein